ncbi:sensor histidine kinase [Lacrimispora saccharolytica]|uniref:Integral membrane sensor signal transduction histidine kinase n=1 Tax=Lacrimispora saccharolytica (strain ATCC 35040 / DSM 2544 / NRCC 2533 / WM1) TaxID=610130 RepID=D9RAI4_LACSW|nr:histidine kinase [Lacrimispora saccharolytica]ADL04262.1 integral membrane sensor signal transduction histidine kinase [[Clostridium] saccharolyticum WM1]QRV21459.1 histidine kinase [Lacrimispora saccharolytica]
MIKRLKETVFKFIGDRKIASKIRLCMFSIDIMLTIFICIFARSYFNKLYYEEVEMQMQDTMNVISESLNNMYDTLLTNVISFASTPAIQRVVISGRDESNYINQEGVQVQLINLVSSNSMIESVFMVNKDGTCNTVYAYGVRPEKNLSDFLTAYGAIDEITWLPNCQSPFLQQQDVIPIVIPLSTLTPGDNVVITTKGEEVATRLVVLLNLQKFQSRLSLSNANYFERSYFVVDSMGNNISLKNPQSMKMVLENQNFIQGVQANNRDTLIRQIADLTDNVVYSQMLPFSELQLISVLSKESLNRKISAMNQFIVLMGGAGLIFSVAFSALLSKFITSPLERLMVSIRQIQENHYDEPYETKYDDEIGQLNAAVNSMYRTIQSQISQIKEDEHEKYQLEIQLLAEQINPHLLYNTLEGINLEVLNNHTLVASSMINNLGTFMRIGLNYGDELIMIRNEIAHVEAYINIMNHRTNQSISFQPFVEEGLKEYRILKLILQPLVENSIKHGFREDQWGEAVCIPSIEVRFYRKEGRIFIEVVDNGSGIDIDKAREAIYRAEPAGGQHIGLHNIYTRLKIYYGEAEMDFQTIPYYRNSVVIRIPEKQEP